jgi:hypothetical protein
VLKSVTIEDTHHVYFGRPLVCFNALQLDAALSQIPSGVSAVQLHITDLVTLIDHTAATMLLEFVENFQRTGRGIASIIGLERLRARAHAGAAMRISAPVLAQERAEALETLAKISLTHVSPEQPDAVAFLGRVSLTHVGPIPGQDNHVINQAVARAWRHLVRRVRSLSSSIRSLLVFRDTDVVALAEQDLSLSGLGQFEPEEVPSEIEKLSLSSHEYPRPHLGGARPSTHRSTAVYDRVAHVSAGAKEPPLAPLRKGGTGTGRVSLRSPLRRRESHPFPPLTKGGPGGVEEAALTRLQAPDAIRV